MLYEKLSLNQFESALKKSSFNATKDEVDEIRQRVLKRLILKPVKDRIPNSESNPNGIHGSSRGK